MIIEVNILDIKIIYKLFKKRKKKWRMKHQIQIMKVCNQ